MDIDLLLWFQNIREALGPIAEQLADVISMLSTIAVFVLYPMEH